MSVIRHWVATAPREYGDMPLAVARDEAHVERLRLDGWAVEGPFVPEQHRGTALGWRRERDEAREQLQGAVDENEKLRLQVSALENDGMELAAKLGEAE